jgi:hypothetical protein
MGQSGPRSDRRANIDLSASQSRHLNHDMNMSAAPFSLTRDSHDHPVDAMSMFMSPECTEYSHTGHEFVACFRKDAPIMNINSAKQNIGGS